MWIGQLSAALAELAWTEGDSVGAQKRAYLLQAAGGPMPYRFTWNRMGPYSSVLADDLVDIGEPSALPAALEEPVERVRAAIEASPAGDVTLWLELLSSLHYLAGNSGDSFDAELPASLRDDLLVLKPQLNDVKDHFDAAWSRLASIVPQTVA